LEKKMSTFLRVSVIGLAAVLSACTIKDTEPPDLTGPSGYALRIVMQAVPDSILQDGASQTVINIEATGADGRPVRGLVLRVDQVVDGQPFDFGTVSAKTVVTGDDGRARIIYTAPPRDTSAGHLVQIFVTPIGSDFGSESPRSVNIQLVPVGIILPPNQAPTARFTFSPLAPTTLQTVTFDASSSGDERDADGNVLPCGPTCTYQWDFGDGTTATGMFVTHQYTTIGNFLVRLTVTDARGASDTTAQSVPVGPGVPPSGSFTVAPAQPAVNEPVLFNAAGVRAAPGRTIVSYEWNFGNGRIGSGVTTSTTYSTAGSYPVTLTVTDDAGNTQTLGPVTVTVSASGDLTAVLTVSPNGGSTATTFFFDASASRQGPSPIVEYRFTFGDGTPDVVGPSSNTAHRYLAPGTYTARLTIRDSAGRTATTTQPVTVAPPAP
jgi:PKD repeat protein